jgi:predicted dehydrogenase
MKFLIAGYGSIGRRHFQNLKALGQKDILFYRSGKGQLEDKELDGFIVENDIEAALEHNPDAVIVSNPTALHLDVAIPAAQAGCHLLLEKPISHTMEGIDELQDAVAKSGSRVLVGFQLRFHPGLLKIADWLSSGELGDPLFGSAHWGEYLPDWHPWEDYRKGYSARNDLGGGVVLTLSHPFDYLSWLLGPVQAVSAATQLSAELDIVVEDRADIILQHARGAQINVHLDYLQKPPSHTMELVLSRGMLRWDASNAQLHIYRSESEEWETLNLAAEFERNDLFLALMSHFIKVVEGAAPVCSLDDGIAALEIALAVHESAKSGQIRRLGG